WPCLKARLASLNTKMHPSMTPIATRTSIETFQFRVTDVIRGVRPAPHDVGFKLAEIYAVEGRPNVRCAARLSDLLRSVARGLSGSGSSLFDRLALLPARAAPRLHLRGVRAATWFHSCLAPRRVV